MASLKDRILLFLLFFYPYMLNLIEVKRNKYTLHPKLLQS